MTDNLIPTTEFDGDGVKPDKFPDAAVKTQWLYATLLDKFDVDIAKVEKLLDDAFKPWAVPAAKVWKQKPVLSSGESIPKLQTTSKAVEEAASGLKQYAESVRTALSGSKGNTAATQLAEAYKAPIASLESLSTKNLPAVKAGVDKVGDNLSKLFDLNHSAFREVRSVIATGYSDASDPSRPGVPLKAPDEKKEIGSALSKKCQETTSVITNAAKGMTGDYDKLALGDWQLSGKGTVSLGSPSGNPKGSDPKGNDPKNGDPKKGGPKGEDPKNGDPKSGSPAKPGAPQGEKPTSGNPSKPEENKAQNPQQPQNQQPQQSPQQSMPQMPQVSMPQTPNTSGLENTIGSAIGKAVGAAAQPHEEKPKDEKPKDEKPKQKDEGSTHTTGVAGVPKPGDPVRPHQFGADGKPLDKDGDGKMDSDAVPATKDGVLGPDGKPKPVEYEIKGVDKDGNPTTVTAKGLDPRTAEAAAVLGDNKGIPGKHTSVLDAYREAGVKLDNIGQSVFPTNLRVGDVIKGEGEGIFLGGDKVMCEDGRVRPLSEVMRLGEGNGVFRPELPSLPGGESAPTDGPPPADKNAGPPPPAPQSGDTPPPPSAQQAGAPSQPTGTDNGAAPVQLQGQPAPPQGGAPDGGQPASAEGTKPQPAPAAPSQPEPAAGGTQAPAPAPAGPSPAPPAPQGGDTEGIPGLDQTAPTGAPTVTPYSGKPAGT